MNEQEQRFLGLMEQHRQIIYKVCFMYASDDETISDLYQEVTLNLCFGGRLAQAAIDTNYHDAFMEFYYLEDNADLLRDHLSGCYGDGTMREDNIEEWMHLYFEKLLMINDN